MCVCVCVCVCMCVTMFIHVYLIWLTFGLWHPLNYAVHIMLSVCLKQWYEEIVK